jgi:hypothetical protein
MSEQQEPTQDVSLETPLGKLAARGVRTSDIIGLMTLLAVSLVLSIIWRHDDTEAQTSREMVHTMKDLVDEARIQTCVLMLDPAERKREMSADSPMCNRVVRGPRPR